jgi:8-oxo-dGTP diphosphatase
MEHVMVKRVRVAVKAVIVRDGKLLVTKNIGHGGVFYLLPGGGQDHGESLHDALRRECREEIGADVEIQDLLFVRDYIGRHHEFTRFEHDVHQLEIMFRCALADGAAPTVGARPDIYQVSVEWLDLSTPEAASLYPRALLTILQSLDSQNGPVYLGDVN